MLPPCALCILVFAPMILAFRPSPPAGTIFSHPYGFFHRCLLLIFVARPNNPCFTGLESSDLHPLPVSPRWCLTEILVAQPTRSCPPATLGAFAAPGHVLFPFPAFSSTLLSAAQIVVPVCLVWDPPPDVLVSLKSAALS